MFAISFSLGVCFTLGCFYLQACCKPKQGPRNQKTKPTVVPQPPIKRASPTDTPNTNQPTPKRARPLDNNTPTARYHGHAKHSVVTIPWPIPSKLPWWVPQMTTTTPSISPSPTPSIDLIFTPIFTHFPMDQDQTARWCLCSQQPHGHPLQEDHMWWFFNFKFYFIYLIYDPFIYYCDAR